MSTYRCYIPSFGETEADAREVDAFDAWTASKRHAEIADKDSGCEMASNALSPGHEGYIVHVIATDGRETKWRVWPEAEVRWYAGTVAP